MFFETFDLVSHVGQYLLLGGSVIGTYNGADLLCEGIGEILCQHVQISDTLKHLYVYYAR